jgi:hypothetical protein
VRPTAGGTGQRHMACSATMHKQQLVKWQSMCTG